MNQDHSEILRKDVESHRRVFAIHYFCKPYLMSKEYDAHNDA